MKKFTVIVIGIVVVIISALTILNTPSDTIILLPSPYADDKESSVQVLAEDLVYPTNIAILPDERIVVTEQKGKVLFFNSNGSLLNSYELSENYFDEGAGLLGVAIHPQFINNHYLYLYYTYGNNDSSQLFNKVIR